jgi:AcrR family transcriptional regulator
MDAARVAFAEGGPDLPMEEIAKRAGVGIGTVYRHFPNKVALLDALLHDQVSEHLDRTLRALAKDDAWEAFRDLVREGAEMTAKDQAYCEIVMSWKTDTRSPEVIAVMDEIHKEMSKLLERAKAQGGMRPDFTVDDVPVMFAGIAGSIRNSQDDSWKRQVEFVLDGISAH